MANFLNLSGRWWAFPLGMMTALAMITLIAVGSVHAADEPSPRFTVPMPSIVDGAAGSALLSAAEALDAFDASASVSGSTTSALALAPGAVLDVPIYASITGIDYAFLIMGALFLATVVAVLLFGWRDDDA